MTFTVPEGDFQQLSGSFARLSAGAGDQGLQPGNRRAAGHGQLSIADNHVDPATGTVELKARFPNAERHLWPGQFVNVQLTLADTSPGHHHSRDRGQPGAKWQLSSLWWALTRKSPCNRSMWAGPRADTVVIKSGVKPGEIVVTDGQMILKAGSLVRIADPAHKADQAVNLASPFIHRPVATTLWRWVSFWWALSAIRCCRWRRCRMWISRPCRSAPRCPAPAPRPWPPTSPRPWSGSSR